MNKETLFAHSIHVRSEIEKHKDFHSHRERNMTVFPGGRCDDASWILWKYFSEKWISGFKRMYASWYYLSEDISHVWLENDEFSVDITGDQFSGSWNYQFDPVVVIPRENYFFNLVDNAIAANGKHGHLLIESQPSDVYETWIVNVPSWDDWLMNITDFYQHLLSKGLVA